MKISDNIKWITESTAQWRFYRNKSYKAKIQLADPELVYNVPDRPGVVYNKLEDSYEKVGGAAAVVTGAAGEMWPIGTGSLKKYDIAPENITKEAQSVDTIVTDDVFAAVKIPLDTQFTVEVNYGEAALLKGNAPGIDHSDGDYVLVPAKLENGVYTPDFTDSGRIINGAEFDVLYGAVE